MLHSTFVAPAQGIIEAYLNKPERHFYKGMDYMGKSAGDKTLVSDSLSMGSPLANVNNLIKKNILVPGKQMIKAPLAMVLHADIKEGMIGVSKDKPIDNPSDNLFRFTINQVPANAKAYLSYDVYGVNDHNGVARSINQRASVGGHMVKKHMGWSHQKEEINPAWLKEGENDILFTITKGADFYYKIKDLSIVFEQVTGLNQIMVLQQEPVTLLKDNTVYIKGFLKGNHLNAKIEADGTILTVNNNEFEGYIQLTEIAKKSKFITVKAIDASGLLGQELLFMDNSIEAEKAYPIEENHTTATKLFAARQKNRIAIEGAGIMVSDSALTVDKELSVTQLRAIDIAPMESGMVNVTKGGRAYRFLPDGTKFNKPVNISVAYDSLLIPNGYSPKDIKTYFFDTHSKSWRAVEKDSVDVKNNMILSKTTHFSDYINGIIQVPESPETSAFTPTMMNDIKAADPSAEMTLMAPPQASQSGDANVSYPIKIPAGRHGMQPNLAIQYSSSGGNGWLGDGWNIATPAITIDTRWGAPVFDPNNETELYSMNGEMLVYPKEYLPHRHNDISAGVYTTNPQARVAEMPNGYKLFIPRKQGSFERIERYGTNTGNYYWKVIGTDGTISWYGGKNSVVENAVIRTVSGKIAHWALYLVEDVYGNEILYKYTNQTINSNLASGANANLANGKLFYLHDIFYTGKNGTQGNYQVEFLTENDFTPNPVIIRPDVTISGRLGMKQVEPFRLNTINVRYGTGTAAKPVIRSYYLNYGIGKLRKSKLLSVTETAATPNEAAYTHTFDYYDDITQGDTDVYFDVDQDFELCNEAPPCPDSDGDGVCDDDDDCPDVPGLFSHHGCPEDPGRCKTVSFTVNPVNLVFKFDNQSFGPSYYNLNTNLQAFVTDFQQQFGSQATVSPTIVNGVVTTLTLTIIAVNPPSTVSVNSIIYNFIDCQQPRPALALTSTSASTANNWFDTIEDDYSINFSGSNSSGNPDCPKFTNFDFLIQGVIPSFQSAGAVLGSTKSKGWGANGYLGVGIGWKSWTNGTTFGLGLSKGWDKAISLTQMIDIDGDGLEDIVSNDGGSIYYKKHIVTVGYNPEGQVEVNHSFQPTQLIKGVDKFYRQKSTNNSTSFSISMSFGGFGAFAGKDGAHSKSESDIFFTDGNGDGLPDIVRNGQVYFNRLVDGVPFFEADSKNTENMVITASPKEIETPAEYFEDEIEFPKHDIVKVWEAPADGEIKITNTIDVPAGDKSTMVSVEMKKNQPDCYSVSFVPSIYYFYSYGQVHASLEVVNINRNCNDPLACLGDSSAIMNSGSVNGVSVPAPNNLYISNGNINGPLNQCELTLPVGGCNAPTICDNIESSDFIPRFNYWLENQLLVTCSPTYINSSVASLLSCYTISPNSYLKNHHNASGKFISLTPGFEVSTNMKVTKASYPENNEFPFLLYNPNGNAIGMNLGFSQDDIPHALETNIAINGVSVGTYSLYNSTTQFNQFKTAVEFLYPNTEVTIDEETNIITITSTSELNTITLTSTSNTEVDSYNFEKHICAPDYIPRPLLATNIKSSNGKMPTLKEVDLDIKRWIAKGNLLKKEIDDIALDFYVMIDNSSEEFNGEYHLTKYKDDLQWKNWKNEIIKDRILTEELWKKVSKGYKEYYETFQKNYKEQELNRRKEEYELALKELPFLEEQQQLEFQQKFQQQQLSAMSVNTATCADEPGDLCMILGMELQPGSHVSNSISTYSTECGGGTLFARKGDKIYFRVHSIDTGNPAVDWNPKVEYTNATLAATVDENGLLPYASSYSDGFLLSQTNNEVVFAGNGTASFSWPTILVNNPSDKIVYEIAKKTGTVNDDQNPQGNTTPETIIYRKTCNANATTSVSPSTNEISGINLNNYAVTGYDAASTDPNVTVFYFRVKSTSNTNWKQFEWRPKMVCTTSQQVIGDNGPEGPAEFIETKYPVPDYSVYKLFGCSSSYNRNTLSGTAQATTFTVQPSLSGIFASGDNGLLNFVVKRNGKLIGQKTVTINNGGVSISGNAITATMLTATDKIEVGYYSDDSLVANDQSSLLSKIALTANKVATITYSNPASTVNLYKQNVVLYQKANPKFGPMYRQWGQFVYAPAAVSNATALPGLPGNFIKEDALVYTTATAENINSAVQAIDGLNLQDIDLNDPNNNLESTLDQFQNTYGNLLNVALLSLRPQREYISGAFDERWVGMHLESYASALSYRAEKMDRAFDDEVDPFDEVLQDVLQTGAYAMSRFSKSKGKNLSAGGSYDVLPGATVGLSGAKSLTQDPNTRALTDYVDMNGDRYPDLISTTKVQFTTRTGGLNPSGDLKTAFVGNINSSASNSWGVTASGSFYKGSKEKTGSAGANQKDSPKPSQNGTQTGQASAEPTSGSSVVGVSGNFSSADTNTTRVWMDINGDGLNDLLEKSGNDMSVKMNFGYNQFDTNFQSSAWPGFELNKESSSSFGGGLGYNNKNRSIEGGISLGKNVNNSQNILMDMNADGLADLVSCTPANLLFVRINDGNGFGPLLPWSIFTLYGGSSSTNSSLNITGTYAFIFPLYVGIGVIPIKYAAVSGGTSRPTSTNNTKKTIADFDGDGYPDLLQETTPGHIKVKSSRIRRTDMLKSVSNPLGGRFTVNYDVVRPTYDNPSAKWVMTDVVVEDGYDFNRDGADAYWKKFEYTGARYDRRERESYGFETVKTFDYNVDQDGAPTTIYRTNVTKYENRNYFLHGLVKQSYVLKGNDETKIFSKSENTYSLKSLTPAGLIDLTSNLATTFDTGGQEGRKPAAVLLTKTYTYLYELGQSPLINIKTMDYDAYGNITRYSDTAGYASSDDYHTTITYHNDAALLAKNIVGIPKQINVLTGLDDTQTTVKRVRSTTVNVDTGSIAKVMVNLDSNPTSPVQAVTQMEYDANGNLKKITYPPNDSGQSMTYIYTYDTNDSKYVISTLDAYGYTSSATYDYRFDKPLTSTDISGNIVTYTYDNFGRLLTVLSPKEADAGKPYTISFSYYPTEADLIAKNNNCYNSDAIFVPVAVTRHYDSSHSGNDIETVTLMDGLGRPIQVKKDIEINTGTVASPHYEERMSVSGISTYDQFGRVITQYHPWHEAKECRLNYVFNPTSTANSSSTSYDEMDRPVQMIDAENHSSSNVYSIATDVTGTPSAKTKTTVVNTPANIITEVYKDITGKVLSSNNVLQGSGGAENIWTTFTYNEVGELMQYTDAEGKSTYYSYDFAGRKTQIKHPDNGTTNYVYDKVGNLTKLQTANLAANTNLQPADRYIKYSYDYTRPKRVDYPNVNGNPNISNVEYSYGTSGNDKGRVVYQKDATGRQYFQYGKMGEVVYNKREVVGPNIPTRVFDTYFDYDSWNRVKTIVYPDGENVTYGYNLGGNLVTIDGVINGSPYSYLKRVDYDYFEQRTYQKMGNNTETSFQYTAGLRRLDKLQAKTSGQELMMDNKYTYDNVGNVVNLDNNALANSINKIGGFSFQYYIYDNLNRLAEAGGTFDGDESQLANGNDYNAGYYTYMAYNKTHGIVSKEQGNAKNYGSFDPATSFNNTYAYIDGTHKVKTITDGYTQTVETYDYDYNGNMTKKMDTQGNGRSLYWDESNRLRVVADQHSMQHSIYDAGGERVLKANSAIESLYENGTLVSSNINIDTYTTYPNPYIVVDGDGQYTKHYYDGSKRFVTRIGESGAEIFEGLPVPRPAAGAKTDSYSEENVRQQQIKDLTLMLAKDNLGVPVFKKYKPGNDDTESNSIDSTDESESNQRALAATATAPQQFPFSNIYFYHSDHLGSNSFLTDANGQPYQFFINLPFGEAMAEQHALTEDYESPYKFNGKELDAQTGLYYYGARYYDPRTSIWLSTDPLMEKYPNVNPYVYCVQNPINIIDPDGRDWGDPEVIKKLLENINNKISELKNKNIELNNQLTSGNLTGKALNKANDTIKDNVSRLSNLEQTIVDITKLGDDHDHVYIFNNPSNKKHNVYNTEEKNSSGQLLIEIRSSDEAIAIHEIRHVAISLAGKGLNWDENNKLTSNRNPALEEVNAYRAQYSLNPSTLPAATYDDINTITPEWVSLLNDNGQPLYPAVRKMVNDVNRRNKKTRNTRE